MRALRLLTLTLVGLFSAPLAAQDVPRSFLERFVLSQDRTAALEELTPGTDTYDYFRCLDLQHRGELAPVDRVLADWRRRDGETSLYWRIRDRQSVLRLGGDTSAAIRALEERLSIEHDDEPVLPGVRESVPTSLDPEFISRAALTQRALDLRSRSVSGVRTGALVTLASRNLGPARIADLLQRLDEADFPGLTTLVLGDLDNPRVSFGDRKIHQRLTLAQLGELVAAKPELLDDSDFITGWLLRLLPAETTDWRREPEMRLQVLEGLIGFAGRLAPTFNSLKAHLAFHRLRTERQLGRLDEGHLQAYLRLPRRFGYVRRDLWERAGRALVDPSNNPNLGLAPIRDDSELIRECLLEVLADAGSYQAYSPFVRKERLERWFLEAKVLAGVGDPAQWLEQIDDPGFVDSLRQRVELRFAPDGSRQFQPEEVPTIEVDTKNVDRLIVRVFEIDTLNVCTSLGKNVDQALDLEGLVANEERVLDINANPFRRVRQSIDFPTMSGRGVWIVELLGNGVASRAVIRKGGVRTVERLTSAGHVFRIHDLDGRLCNDAWISFGGRRFDTDERGEVLVPFSTDPDRKSLIVVNEGLAVVQGFDHKAESYDLRLRAHVEYEAMLPGERASFALRPVVRVSGRPASLSVFEEAHLQIRAVDNQGRQSVIDRRDVSLSDDAELIEEIRVPENLSSLQFTLRGRVESLTGDEPVWVSATTEPLQFRAIDLATAVQNPLIRCVGGRYLCELRGKSGELIPNQVLNFAFGFHDFTDPMTLELRTDAAGVIDLGTLETVESVSIGDSQRQYGSWAIDPVHDGVPRSLVAGVDETIVLDYAGSGTTLSRAQFSLVELRGSATRERVFDDRFDALELRDGTLSIRGLGVGQYLLRLRELNARIPIDVLPGRRSGGLIRSEVLWAAGFDPTPLQVRGISESDGFIEIQLRNEGPNARVHVTASRYLPPHSLGEDLQSPVRWSDPTVDHGPSNTAAVYTQERRLGDEIRYILNRRTERIFPGNMLARTGLILNPWSFEDTETGRFDGDQWNDSIGVGGGAGGRGGGRLGGRARRQAAGANPGDWFDLTFLPDPARTLWNLRPNDDGVIRIDRAVLGGGSWVEVVVVDGLATASRSFIMEAQELQPLELGFRSGLDPQQAYAETRAIEVVDQDQAFEILTVGDTEAKVLDSLRSVFELFQSVSNNPELATFEFLLRWPDLDEAEQRALYAAHACHELHLFLWFKDREFFQGVVRPFLDNKIDRTFIDRWLLEDDLRDYLDPWAFERLNAAEKALLCLRLEAEGESVGRFLDEEGKRLASPDRRLQLFRALLAYDALSHEGVVLRERLRGLVTATTAETRAGRRPSGPTTGNAPSRDAAPAESPPRTGGEAPSLEPAEEAEEALDADDFFLGEDRDRSADRRRRAEIAQARFYRSPAATKRLIERNYWGIPEVADNASRLVPDSFWAEFALSGGVRPFVSTQVLETTDSLREMLLALAILDLPFDGAEHQPEEIEGGTRFTAAHRLLLARRQLRSVETSNATNLLVSQKFFRPEARTRVRDGVVEDVWVDGEFLRGQPYGLHTVVTNPSSRPVRAELLMQVPEGALPVGGSGTAGQVQRILPITLGSYGTQSFELLFYFPRSGEAAHYPVQLSVDGVVVASATPAVLDVVDELAEVDTTTWAYVANQASTEDLLAYLQQQPLHGIDLGAIAWRMKDREVFNSVLTTLRARHRFHHRLWDYGFLHSDQRSIRETLTQRDSFLRGLGPSFAGEWISVNPVERRWFARAEFAPLLHRRAHRFGPWEEIQNAEVTTQLHGLLSILAHQDRIDDVDRLALTYGFLLQDRVEDALEVFAQVDRSRVPARLQYDALDAYLAFYLEDLDRASAIAQRYQAYPVDHWRSWFGEVATQLAEARGVEPGVAGQAGGDTVVDLAAATPSLDLQVDGSDLVLEYGQLDQCQVRFFPMDVELLFSSRPFVQSGGQSASFVRPAGTLELSLQSDENRRRVAMPAEFARQNVLVEVRSAGLVRQVPVYASALSVRWVESQGQLKVTDPETGLPISKVYVKVYRRNQAGGVEFFKDGYTDIRGRFDYASVSGSTIGRGDQFSVLVLSDDRGAVLREVASPVR
ncbi:MAG: hypothetical protein AAF196_13050 [Planctomycetota bacterium]